MNLVKEPEKKRDEINRQVAKSFLSLIHAKEDACIGLPTGRTPAGMYRLIREMASENTVDFSNTNFFGLDEYIDTDNAHKFKAYLEKNLYKPLAIDAKNCFNPLEINDYDSLIEEKGGLDLTILGLGINGHIAFNEPETIELSWTHCVNLTKSTKQANQEFFKNGAPVPTRAVTMGLQTLLKSRKIILLVFGSKKRNILEKAMKGEITAEIPASYLKLHKNLEIHTDFDFDG